MSITLKQFDIVLVDLNPVRGSEQRGEARPCLILQTNASGQYGKTTLIAPLTTNAKKCYPFEVLIKKDKQNNLSQDSKVKCDQIRVIDKQRIIKKMGIVSESYHVEIDKALMVIFDFLKDFR